jgi:ADP-ribosylglycohydrolase
MKPETKYKGSIKLAAIGDALGWITEFEKSNQSLAQKYGVDSIEQFFPWEKKVGGRFYGFTDYIKPGSYSDDTQLLMAVARSIKSGGNVDNNYFGKVELANWLDYARGGGRTVKAAADKISRKSATWFNNFFNFKVNGENFEYTQTGANGAAMRILPIALANLGNNEKINEEIFCNSIVTHGHPRAILGAMIYGYAVNKIIVFRPEDFNWDTYITQIGTDFRNKFELTFSNRHEIKEWLKIWNKSNDRTFESVYDQTLIEAQSQLRYIYTGIKQNRPVQEVFQKLGCFDNSTKGSGIVTVIAGIYLAAKFHSEPLKAIVHAVNALGSDTDSIAAFTGGLIGALHGQGIIPEKWKKVQDVNYLDEIADRLLAISEDRFTEEKITDSVVHKSLNSLVSDSFEVNDEVTFSPLGNGVIRGISRQKTLTKGKYNLIIEIELHTGQSILISKIFDDLNLNTTLQPQNSLSDFLLLAEQKLTKKTFDKLVIYIENSKGIDNEQLTMLFDILKNEQ